jgi:hypothetical protein
MISAFSRDGDEIISLQMASGCARPNALCVAHCSAHGLEKKKDMNRDKKEEFLLYIFY